MQSILLIIIQTVLILILSPVLIGIIRKIKARFQNRQGASIIQPYRDLWKLFHKDEIIARDASWIFRFMPYFLFALTVVIAAGIPVLSVIGFEPTNDFLMFVYLLAFGTFFLALAGMDTGSAFGGFGSSREMMVAAITEGGMVFALLTPMLISGSNGFSGAITSLQQMPVIALAPVFVAFIAFMISAISETGRVPVDNPATHLELTMIHEAMILEYSGKRLALIEWASANKLLIFITLAVNLFFPWGVAQSSASLLSGTVLIALLVWLVKVIIVATIIAVLESSIAKLRIFRVPDLLFTSFILGVIAVGIIIF